MDKKIIEQLIKLGLITTHVNPDNYKDIDDLMATGVISMPINKKYILNALNIDEEITDITEPKEDDTVVKPVETKQEDDIVVKPVETKEKETEIIVEDKKETIKKEVKTTESTKVTSKTK